MDVEWMLSGYGVDVEWMWSGFGVDVEWMLSACRVDVEWMLSGCCPCYIEQGRVKSNSLMFLITRPKQLRAI